jgi:hypothetical protein
MSTTKSNFAYDHIFLDTAEMKPGVIGAVVSNDEMREQGAPFFFLTARRGTEWLEGGGGPWDAYALVSTKYPLEQLAVIGPHGNVHLTGSGDRHQEYIEDGSLTPRNVGLLRGANTIDGLAWVCGMKKQVYQRTDANRWQCVSKDIVGGEGVHGFEAIDGFSATDVYAVGWNGEVWHFDGIAWHKKEVATDVILTEVCCAGNGVVYALGRGQQFLLGRDNHWQVTSLDLPTDLISLCWFQDALYAASAADIFKLTADGTFEPVVIPGDRPTTCGKLAVGTGIMLSAGERDWFTFDGTDWKRID